MAVNLLPLFRHLIVKCRKRGAVVVMWISRQTKWTSERSNIHRRYIVSSGSGSGYIVVLQHFHADHLHPESIVSVTGAGDTPVASAPASLTQPPRGFKGLGSLKKIVEDAH